MPLAALKNINLALAFLLELAVLAALGYWGFTTGEGMLVRIGLGIGIPLVAIILWALFGAPRAAWRLHGFRLWILRVVFFGGAAMALIAASLPLLGVVFALICVVNLALISAWAQ
jgi:hypothetical protein